MTKVFGKPASDADGHRFERWLEAANYIGRTFEELNSEERFEPVDSFLGRASMNKSATATSPATSVMDDGKRKRYVSWVAVHHVNPSEQFVGKLIETLTSTWGKARGSDLSSGMKWATSKFSAQLKLEQVSANGPYVSLTIEQP